MLEAGAKEDDTNGALITSLQPQTCDQHLPHQAKQIHQTGAFTEPKRLVSNTQAHLTLNRCMPNTLNLPKAAGPLELPVPQKAS